MIGFTLTILACALTAELSASGIGSFVNQAAGKVSGITDTIVHAPAAAVGKVKDLAPTEENEDDICFSRLGCFQMKKPWKSILRPIPAPYPPENISTALYFYSRPNTDSRQTVTLYPEISLEETNYDPKKPTVFITHGFASNGNSSWMADMKDAYLKQVDANVFIVDWGKGASLFNYLQVAGNTRVVGAELVRFVKFLQTKGTEPQRIHLIGHSLGSHISAYAGKGVRGIGKLTALDPAQPGFETFDKAVRLDQSDAEFVEVIHTDAKPTIPLLGFGMITPHGHVDFYMNGGFEQPGCIIPPKEDLPVVNNILDLAKYPVEVIAKAIACPHGRSYLYYTEALNQKNCIIWGHRAGVSEVSRSVANTLTQGFLIKYVALSTSCSKDDCTPLGLRTHQSTVNGSVVATTNRATPYCVSEPGVPPEESPEKGKSILNQFLG